MASITKRLVEGRPLTNAEVDGNFENLNTQKVERDGSIPMTGTLETPGIQSTSSTNGLRVFNESGQEVAVFGSGNGTDVTFNGSINVGGSGSSLDLEGGSITVNNLFVTGAIVSTQLAEEYGVSGDDEIFTGTAQEVNSKLQLSFDTVLTIEMIQGVFNLNVLVTGLTSGASGTVTKNTGKYLHIALDNSSDEFQVGEIVQYASNTARVIKAVNATSYKPGHKLKLFGANEVGVTSVPNLSTFTPNAIEPPDSTITHYYWFETFRYLDGATSGASAYVTVEHGAANTWTAESHIQITLQRPNSGVGVLIYRGTTSNREEARLIDVLGPDFLGNETQTVYTDFGGFIATEWSTKNEFGQYTENSNIVNFPLTPPSSSKRGWVVAEVESISNNRDVVLTDTYVTNSNGQIEAVHENTEGLQQVIDDNLNSGINSIRFPSGTFYARQLVVPSNFVVQGEGFSSIVKQIPWHFDNYDNSVRAQERGSVFIPQSNTPENIFFRNLTIDGNIINNAKFAEESSNYPINIPNATNLVFDSIKVQNTTSGGIWAKGATRLRVQDSEILNGSLVYSGNAADDSSTALFAQESKYLTMIGNVFENFPTEIDVSVSEIGTISGNTIRNCGSGLLIYASKSMVVTPNLIMGPDNEFIPGPDRYDSDYDSINISVEPGIKYESSPYLYLDGSPSAPVYLGTEPENEVPGTGVELKADVWMLTKLNNVEILKLNDYSQFSGEDTITISNGNEGTFGRNNGYFQFQISAANTSNLPTLSDLYSSHSNVLSSGEIIVGLIYRVIAETYTFTDVDNRIEIADLEKNVDGSVEILLSNNDQFAYFAVGDTVQIFNNATSGLNSQECTVVEKISTSLEKKIRVTLTTPLSGNVATGASGYITIKKSFIIAKGRIN